VTELTPLFGRNAVMAIWWESGEKADHRVGVHTSFDIFLERDRERRIPRAEMAAY
jgi:hypothetical protein